VAGAATGSAIGKSFKAVILIVTKMIANNRPTLLTVMLKRFEYSI
jgi:hypothetical protein